MSRTLPWLCMLLCLTACEDADLLPEGPLTQALVTSATEVTVGEPFELTWLRAWEPGHAPAAPDLGALAPLHLHLLSRAQTLHGTRTVERSLYRAQLFALGSVALSLPALESADPSSTAPPSARTKALQLTAKAQLDPAAPGEPEPPQALWPVPGGGPWAWVGALALCLLAVFVVAWRRRDRALTPHTPRVSAAHPEREVAARLDTLEQELAREPAAAPRVACDVADALRSWLQARYGLPLLQRTTDEARESLQQSEASFPAARREGVLAVLTQADAVKFASGDQSTEQARTALARARALLDASGWRP